MTPGGTAPDRHRLPALQKRLPVPFLPRKLKLSPQSSTLPLGTRYTLTATVVNLGDPANPPIEGFPLGFEVVEGPHVGKNSNSVTDADGKLTFSYPGSQVGSDKISVGFFGEALLELDTAEVTWAGGPDLVVPLFAPPLLQSEGGKTVFISEWTSNLGAFPAASRDLPPTLVGLHSRGLLLLCWARRCEPPR